MKAHFKEALAQGIWNQVGGDIVASSTEPSIPHDMGMARQRFYQVLLMD